ncbi:hypothetical protein NDK47_21865 [Brevibacillus ruminantium]|uniref:Uncharacterized protein n=1 Tax=Brevibacillus ruminantium TaxID=2950604 RepID=A0ABY4WC38_9BACL|nr:hypothetical protein [Brevibacillus ruminantium]USG64746.1 hypothetical protein NDK47_21865 [Brevibacillus ruminantium]
MEFNFLFFSVKIARANEKQRNVEYACEKYLQERAEAQALQAAQYAEFAFRG